MTARLVRTAAVAAALTAAACGQRSSGTSPGDSRAPVTTADPGGGVFRAPITVLLHCADHGAGCGAIHWTADGSEPSVASTTYRGAIVVAAATTLRFRAEDGSGNLEPARTEHYLVDWTAPVSTASPAGGTFNAAQTVTLSCEDAGAGCGDIRYTLDGSAPSVLSPVYSGPLVLAESATLRFFAMDLAGNQEAPRSSTFVVDTAAPTTAPSPLPGWRPGPFEVKLACDDGAGVGCGPTYFTVDGTDPTSASSVFSAPIAASASLNLRWFSVDHVGNAEPVRRGTWDVDGQPPVTTTSPLPGWYNHQIIVELRCTDGLSGCDRTGYRIDSGAVQYATTVALATDTTLAVSSTDRAGNAETPQTVTYRFKSTPPVPVQSWPADGATRVAATTPIRLQFDSQLRGTWAGAGSLTVARGDTPVAGRVSIGDSVVEFLPDAPLDPGTTFTVVASGFVDLAGNVQPAPFQWSFSTAHAIIAVSSPGGADVSDPVIAFDTDGSGAAISYVRTGTGCAFQVSMRNYDSAWTGPRIVSPVVSRRYCDETWKAWGVGGPAGIMLAYQYRDDTGTRRVGWGLIEYGIWITGGSFIGDLDDGSPVAAEPGGWYALVYRQGEKAYAILWYARGGGRWSSPEQLNTPAAGRSPFSPSVAGGPGGPGVNFLVAWRSASSPGSVGTVEIRPWSYSGWGRGAVLATGAGDPAVAADANGFLVSYRTASALQARFGDGVTFGAATPLAFGGNGGVDTAAPVAAGNGARFALAGGGDAAVGVEEAGVVTWVSTTAFSAPGPQAVRAVTPVGQGFAFVGRGTSDVLLRTHDGSGWQPDAQLAAGPALPADVAVARDRGAAVVAFTEQTAVGTRVQIATVGESAAPVTTTPERPSSASGVRLARNASGDVLAAWRQPLLGSTAIFAAVRHAGAWGAATLLGTGAYRPAVDEAAPVAAVAARGDDFAVAWPTDGGRIVSRTLSAGAWSAPEALSGALGGCTTPALGASAAGWGAAFTCLDSEVPRVFAALRPAAAASFGAAVALDRGGVASANPALASNGTTFRVVWSRSSERRAYRSDAADDGGGFAWSPAEPLVTTGHPATISGPVALTTLGGQYAFAVNGSGEGLFAAVGEAAPKAIMYGATWGGVSLVSDGARLAAAGWHGSQTDLATYANGTWRWDGGFSGGDPVVGVRLAGGGGAFAVVWSSSGSQGQQLFAKDAPPGGGWTEARSVPDAVATLSAAPADFDVVIDAAGVTVGAWTQADPSDPSLDRIWAREEP